MAYDYDVLVLGGGAAGLTASGVAANLGAKTLMVEREKLGGDCTWTGCVPSKTLLKAAKVAHQLRHAARYGLTDQPVEIDFARVIAHVHQTREEIYHDADRPELFEEMGVTVRHGQARFVDPHTIEIEGENGTERVSGRFVVVAAGGRPAVPPIDGLDAVPHLTSESLFEIDALPQRLAVIGAGPIGTEMAQAFCRLGAEVTVLDRADRILSNDEADLAAILQETLETEGVRYLLEADIGQVRQEGADIIVEAEIAGTQQTIRADALLVATGRRPNLEDLNLDAAGLDFTRKGITVDDRCRTNAGHVYAVGDVTGRYQFTHMSEHMAKVAVTNALLKLPMKIDTKHVPWVTYTDPELAHVGATEAQLREDDASFEIYRFPYQKIDRAVTEGETTGWIKVFAKKWSGKILGASILGASAGDLICEYALAMRNGISLRQIADTIHPYPTYGLGARRAADQWYARKQSPPVIRLLQKVFGYRGPVIPPDPDRIV